MIFKGFIKKTFNFFGLEIQKINKEIVNLTFDEIYKKKIKKSNPVILDLT